MQIIESADKFYSHMICIQKDRHRNDSGLVMLDIDRLSNLDMNFS